jgi:hypothetical protein
LSFHPLLQRHELSLRGRFNATYVLPIHCLQHFRFRRLYVWSYVVACLRVHLSCLVLIYWLLVRWATWRCCLRPSPALASKFEHFTGGLLQACFLRRFEECVLALEAFILTSINDMHSVIISPHTSLLRIAFRSSDVLYSSLMTLCLAPLRVLFLFFSLFRVLVGAHSTSSRRAEAVGLRFTCRRPRLLPQRHLRL